MTKRVLDDWFKARNGPRGGGLCKRKALEWRASTMTVLSLLAGALAMPHSSNAARMGTKSSTMEALRALQHQSRFLFLAGHASRSRPYPCEKGGLEALTRAKGSTQRPTRGIDGALTDPTAWDAAPAAPSKARPPLAHIASAAAATIANNRPFMSTPPRHSARHATPRFLSRVALWCCVAPSRSARSTCDRKQRHLPLSTFT